MERCFNDFKFTVSQLQIGGDCRMQCQLLTAFEYIKLGAGHGVA
jgi:hypothetical protein